MIKDHIRQLMILNEIQVIASRIIHDEKKYLELADRLEQVKVMIIEEMQPFTKQ